MPFPGIPRFGLQFLPPRLGLPTIRFPVSLRTKLLIGVAVILIPSLILVLIADYSNLQVREADVVAADRTSAETVAGLVDASIDDAVAVGLTIANAPGTRTFDPSLLDPFLQSLSSTFGQFANIVVVDSRGQSVGEMLPYPPGQARINVADRPYFQQVMTRNEIVVSPILIGRRVGRPVAVVAVPIRDRSGRPVGAVLVALNLDYFRAKLGTIQLRENRVIVITDHTGQLAFASNRPAITPPLENLASVRLIATALQGTPATQESAPFPGLEGPQLGAAVPTPRYHWVAAVLQPTATALAPIRRTILIDALSFALALILGITAALFISDQIITPVLRLVQAAQRWQAGHLDVRVQIRTGDEIEVLANSLNATAAALERTLCQLAEADQRLTEERNRLQAILETSPAGILMINAAELVVLANSAAEAYLGGKIPVGTPAEALPTLYRLYRPDGTPYSPDDLPILRALHEGTMIIGTEVIVRRPNGWEIHLLTNAAPLRGPNGQILGSVSVFFDITPIVEEERLRQEFVTSAAHEFRHPLTVIKGYAEVAMRNPAIRTTPVCRELEMIIDAADRANRLANELLQAAQAHLPRIILHYETVDLAKLVRETVARFQATHRTEKYQFVVETQPAEIEGDPTLLGEAITYLLQQATEAMPEGGEIIVRLSSWDGLATVSVTDHGPEVPREAIPYLFRPFGLVPSAAAPARISRPTLPIYLARRIIEESGGWMRAESSARETTISFSLPRRVPAPPPPPTGPAAPPAPAPVQKPAATPGGS